MAENFSTIGAIAYANPRSLPPRPGILTAIAVGDFVTVLLVVLINLAAVVSCIFLYRLTLPPPAPAPVLPLAPSVPLTPYHGDDLPVDGLPRSNRQGILAAMDHMAGINSDRREMADRLLAECGKKMFPDGSTDAFSGDSSSTKLKLHIKLLTGRVEIGNRFASFTPDDGTPPIAIHGNFVTRNGKTQFTSIAIDQAVDKAQRVLGGKINALQAAALVELDRPDSLKLSSQAPLATPPVNQLSRIEHCETIQFNSYSNEGGGWILPTGAVVFHPFTSPVSLDPATGMRRMAQNFPLPPQRKPLTIDHWLIFASAGEYLGSSAVAILLFIGGLRLLGNAGDAPRWHGAYALVKITLASANLFLGLLVNQQLVDGGFLPEVKWLTLGFGLIMQTFYPGLLFILFTNATFREFYRLRGWESSMIPLSWWQRASSFSPDIWTKPQSAIALLLGFILLGADYFLWAHNPGAQLTRSYLFYPAVFSGFMLLIGGVAGVFRRRSAIIVSLIFCVLMWPCLSRADDSTRTTQQRVDEACAADSEQKGALFRQLESVDDAFIPLLKVAAQPTASYNVTLANQTLRNWCTQHALPDSPVAKAAIQDALNILLKRIHAVPYGNDSDDAALVDRIANTSTIIAAVDPWLHERRGRAANSALDLIADAKPDDDQKWNALVARVDDPNTRQLAAQMLGRYEAPDYMDRLATMARTDPNVSSRQVALGCIRQSFRGRWLSPAAEAAVTACLNDPDASIRSSATSMLGEMVQGGERQSAMLLKSPRLDQRQAGADSLAMNPYDSRTVPVILPVLHDKDPNVRAAAVAALIGVEYRQASLIPIDNLLQSLSDPDLQVRFQAACAIRQCQPAYAELGPHTYPLLNAALLAGTNNHWESRRLTDRPPIWLPPAADSSPVTYSDADPLTGQLITLNPALTGAAAWEKMSTLAWMISATGWPLLTCVVIGIVAKAKLSS